MLVHNNNLINKVVVLFILTLIVRCSSPTENKNKGAITSSETNAKEWIHVNDFSKHLVGSIANHAITMNLQAKVGDLSGTYFYHKVGLLLRLGGKFDADGTFQLFEIAPNGDTTGLFSGVLKNEEGLAGTWTNLKTKQSFPFVFSERDTATYVKVTNEHYERSNCTYADSIKALAHDTTENWYDTTCTRREINLLRFCLANKNIADKIYNSLLKNAASMVDAEPSVESMLAVVDGQEIGFEDGVDVYVSNSNTLILSVGVSHAAYWFGAAHPNSTAHSYNFDLRKGSLIELSDILKPGYEDKLKTIAEKIFKEEINNDFDFVMTDDFTIAPGGLQFNYDPYEIGSYAEGYIDIFIPYAKLKGMIKPGSVLELWLKQM